MKLEALKGTLEELCSIVGVSGYEDGVIQYITKFVEERGFKSVVDPLGNVIIQVNQRENAKKLLVFAHMDELGLVITKIEKDGFIRVERLGGIPEKSLAGTEIIIETEKGSFSGVVGTKSHHVTPQEEKYNVKKVSDIYLDLGFCSAEEVANAGIKVGTPVSYARRFFSNGTRVFSNSLDNRAGCVTLLNFLDTVDTNNLNIELFIVFSVQEEFNLRGVLPAVRQINPNFGITIDISIASDTPDLEGRDDVQIGKGPCIGYYTFHGRGTLGGVIPNPKYVRFIEEVVKKYKMETQSYASMGMLTDASFTQLENKGFPIIDLGFPVRYSHAPIESVDLRDLSELTKLLSHIAESLNEEMDFSRG